MDPGGTFERKLSVTGPVVLDVGTYSGVIRVGVGEAGSVLVRGTLRPRRSLFGWGSLEDRIRRLQAEPPVEQDGNTIRIGDLTDKRLLRGLTLVLEIVVPRETEVRALADAADIRVEGIRGPVDCEADSGQIEIANIESRVRVATDSGGIHIRQVKGSVHARTDSADIEALEIGGEIEASTDSSGIQLSQTVAAPIRARSDSGSIGLSLADGAGYNLRVRTDGGRITTPEMTWQEKSSPCEAVGQIRGGGPIVNLESNFGRIDVQ